MMLPNMVAEHWKAPRWLALIVFSLLLSNGNFGDGRLGLQVQEFERVASTREDQRECQLVALHPESKGAQDNDLYDMERPMEKEQVDLWDYIDNDFEDQMVGRYFSLNYMMENFIGGWSPTSSTMSWWRTTSWKKQTVRNWGIGTFLVRRIGTFTSGKWRIGPFMHLLWRIGTFKMVMRASEIGTLVLGTSTRTTSWSSGRIGASTSRSMWTWRGVAGLFRVLPQRDDWS